MILVRHARQPIGVDAARGDTCAYPKEEVLMSTIDPFGRSAVHIPKCAEPAVKVILRRGGERFATCQRHAASAARALRQRAE